VDLVYGGLPPAPTDVDVESLCFSRLRTWPGRPKFHSYRIHCAGGERPLSFALQIVWPETDAPAPVVLTGDGCWWYLTDEIARRFVQAGYAVARFNRTELAPDENAAREPARAPRSGGLYSAYPGTTFGALAAWAWGYHRAVDALRTVPFVDAERIAVTGHSRGGKAALLAGATDTRIAVVNDNAGGTGGAALFRHKASDAESLAQITETFPTWFGPQLAAYAEREAELPTDQHALLAAVAPRGLLLTYALDDRWSNPEGMVLSAQAAREVYRMLDAEDRIAYHLRPGEHRHDPDDWTALRAFLEFRWKGRELPDRFNTHPYDLSVG
jgi:dienelactone hydrolase